MSQAHLLRNRSEDYVFEISKIAQAVDNAPLR